MTYDCCHCGSTKTIPDHVERNIECYGDNTFNIQCLSCLKLNKIVFKRTVKIVNVIKSDKSSEEKDF